MTDHSRSQDAQGSTQIIDYNHPLYLSSSDGMEQGRMPPQANVNQPGACMFTQEQYSQILQMLNKSNGFSANANTMSENDITGSLKWEGEGDW
ncbi:hypothetical protein K7X08_031208 [Anisodus acutangulus]|uniref:Uncharacterized protein n=1 Tax=Anisodus acutangulus TaxID=402998 RepID=A0A9Q1ML90_9SOLA|nr:hypothetical protein K7X08_031208 [Anisodus acutangulus]